MPSSHLRKPGYQSFTSSINVLGYSWVNTRELSPLWPHHGSTELFLILASASQLKGGNVLFNDALNTFYLRL